MTTGMFILGTVTIACAFALLTWAELRMFPKGLGQALADKYFPQK